MNENEQHPITYKVWIEIEQFDTVTEDSHTLPGTPGGPIAEFPNYRHARIFVEALDRLLAMLNLEASAEFCRLNP